MVSITVSRLSRGPNNHTRPITTPATSANFFHPNLILVNLPSSASTLLYPVCTLGSILLILVYTFDFGLVFDGLVLFDLGEDEFSGGGDTVRWRSWPKERLRESVVE